MINLGDVVLPQYFKQFVALHYVKLFIASVFQNACRVFDVGGNHVILAVDPPEALCKFASQLPAGTDQKNSRFFHGECQSASPARTR